MDGKRRAQVSNRRIPDCGEVRGRCALTGELLRVAWDRGRFTCWERGADGGAEGVWLSPPTTDIQVNGYAGVDFQSDAVGGSDLRRAVDGLRRDGCGRIALTLITDGWDRLLARLRRLKRIRDADPELRAAIAGWHVEGPFLSDQPGFCGAHPTVHMCDPTPEAMRELRECAGSDPVLMTLAPERAGSVAAIREAASLGIRVWIGHSNADAGTLAASIAAGAVGMTHWGNGCPQDLDRHDNILLRVLDRPPERVSLIADGIHLNPMIFRVAHRGLPSGAVVYTTDAMAAAGSPPGVYALGPLRLAVGADGVVRQPGRSNFAGSALAPAEGIARASRMLEGVRGWREVLEGFTVRPAECLGIRRDPAPGDAAVFLVLGEDSEGRLDSVEVHDAGLESWRGSPQTDEM